MGKQGSLRSPRPEYLNFELSLGAKESQVRCLKNDPTKFSACKGGGKRHVWLGKHVRSMVLTFGLMGFLFLLDSLLFSILDPPFSSNTRKSIETKVWYCSLL